MKYQYHDAEVTLLEGLMARGDRKIADVIVSAYKNGAMYDSWSDRFSMEYWNKAYEETGIDPDFYTLREREIDEVFPWDFIDCGITKSFLIREWDTAHKDKITPNCRQQCMGCGARKYNGGVCLESAN